MANLIKALREIQNDQAARHQAAEARPLDPHVARLRQWQARRLAGTYADLLADPQYAPACRFFLSDIYAARDFSQRDLDAERLHQTLARFLPAHMLSTLARANQLNRLSAQLDHTLADALLRMGVGETITAEQYAQGYLLCDNYAERRRQIELLVELLSEVCHGAKSPLVGVTLRLARRPAHAMGWFELYDFLQRGYSAARPIRDVDAFVATVLERELGILESIFAQSSDFLI